METNTIDANVQNLSSEFQKEFYEKVYPKIDIKSFEILRIVSLAVYILVCAVLVYYFVEYF